MPFPKKFKKLLETRRGEVEEPKQVWLSYAVCGVVASACGWGGWILESVMGKSGNLPANTEQVCPLCGKPVFRTEAATKFQRAPNQNRPLVAGRDYKVTPMKYK
jgi:hypothetical protein